MRSITAPALLALLLILFTSNETITANRPRQRIYRSPKLGITFRFPFNWAYERCKASYGLKDCVGFYALRRNGKRSSEDYTLIVEVKRMDLEKAIESDGAFDKVDGQWTASGRGAPQKAMPISGANWRGIYVVVACPTEENGNFHAAAGECLLAILSNGSRSVSLTSDGIVPPKMVLNEVVKSFKFIE